jgi:hypothetical protein
MRRVLLPVLAAVLAVAAVWLLRSDPRGLEGAEWCPSMLRLHVGERAEIRLVSHEPRVIAASFRLRFDEGVVAVDAAEPAYASVLTGGNALVLPIRRAPGLVELPGLALTGERPMKPSAPLYRFTVRALAPGTATLRVEALSVIDADGQRRTLEVVPADVRVAAP